MTLAVQLSVAVACPVADGSEESEQLIWTLGGHTMTGSVSSMIQISCTHVLELPQASVADQVLLRRPVPLQPKRPVMSSVKLITSDCTGVQLSVALAAPVKSGLIEDSQLIVAGGGQKMVGFSRSVTVMIWLHVVLLPHASVTLQVLRSVTVPLQPGGTIFESV